MLKAHDKQTNDTQASKDVKVARLYCLVFLTRRLIMVFVVVLVPDPLSLYKIPILIVLQTVYLVYSIFKRSFEEWKDQMVEIFNEFVFLILLMLLLQYLSEPDWTDTAENAFIGIIMSQISILTIVSMTSGIIKLV